MDLTEFAGELEDEILTETKNPDDAGENGEGEAFKEEAFTRIAQRDMADAGALDGPTECHYVCKIKGRECKVNGYEISDEDARLDLVITDYRPYTGGEVGKLNADDVERNFRMAERFLDYLFEANNAGPDISQRAHAMISDISARRDELQKVQISLVTNSLLAIRRERPKTKRAHGLSISREIWDLERFRRLRAGGSSHEPIEVDLSRYPGGGISCLSNTDPQEGYSTSIATLPGALLADWYEEYGSRLLELNVRSYLQAKGKINKGILETLLKEPERFLAYNNGITIVAEAIEYTADQSRIRLIRGLQIVNGGQTTASIHRARREHRADLSRVYVQAKITKVPPERFEEIVPEISRLSNTQNKVSEVDLRAHHRYHLGLERVAARKWVPGEQSKWFYERTRGSYQTERNRRGRTKAQRDRFDREFPPEQRLTKEDVARYVNVYDGSPHIVSLGGQKNFKHFMDGVADVGRDWEPADEEYKELIGKAILYRKTQSIAKEIGISAFKVNVVNYTVALVATKTDQRIGLSKIWDAQDISPALRRLIGEWLPKVGALLTQSAMGRNPTEWFKTEPCWTGLRKATESWQIPDSLARELRVAEAGRDVAGGRTQVERIKSLTASEWLRVYQWGEQSDQLTRLQVDIARRMSELAFEGWRRNPTVRQVAEAEEIISAFEQRT